MREYRPAYELWSDGAQKRRFVSLPAKGRVDLTQRDAFTYPVGTQFWKEFRVADGKGGHRLGETRLLRKVEGGWLRTSYVWNEAGTDAVQTNDGAPDLFGSGHTVPTRKQCVECHQGREDFILGWDPVLLGEGSEGDVLTWLRKEGRAVDADAESLQAGVPGDAVEQAALGYLHVNCGVSCHNRSTLSAARMSGLFLALRSGTLARVADTDAFTSALNKLPSPNRPAEPADPGTGRFFDVRPGDPTRSLLLARMKLRGGDGQMPPIGTNRVDADATASVTDWIERMTPARGYPAAAD